MSESHDELVLSCLKSLVKLKQLVRTSYESKTKINLVDPYAKIAFDQLETQIAELQLDLSFYQEQLEAK